MRDGDTVLVTGGSGFVGSYVVHELLRRGYSPVVVDVAPYRDEARYVIGEADIGHIPYEEASIGDWPRMMEIFTAYHPRAVVHAGGMMDDRYLSEHPTMAVQVNVGGGLCMLEASRLMDVERFIFVSSIAVIGRCVYEPMDAAHPVITATHGPLGAYGAAKLSVEAFCFSHQKEFGLDTRIVRPSAVYGFGMSWFAPNYMKNIVEPAVLGEEVHLSTGGTVPRDYTHVGDVASLITAILEGPDDMDRVFYAATGRDLRVAREVGQVVEKLVPGASIQVREGWTDVDRAELPLRGRYSIDNARSQLNWLPIYAELEDGVREYIERFKGYIASGGRPTPRPLELKGAPGMAGDE